MEVNKPKNRYANVIAYDHSRVVLTSVDGKGSGNLSAPSHRHTSQIPMTFSMPTAALENPS